MDQPWIREQIDIFIGDRANFFTTASPKQKDTSGN
jgi:hypothetical protein